MRIFYSFLEYWKSYPVQNAQQIDQSVKKPLVLCIGNFDGVHIGHQELINKTKQVAQKIGGRTCILTFDPHPFKILLPQVDYKPLFDLADRLEQFKLCGVDEVIIQPFDLQFAEVTASDFLENYLLAKTQPNHVVVGYNFSFGKKGLGKPEMMKQKLPGLTVIPPIENNGYVVSSSKIKELLSVGNISEANICLGRPYSLSGIVVKGDQRGRTIGFPTANILNPSAGHLKKGVYRTQITLGGKLLNSITNVGVNPTINSSEQSVKVETHIFDFSDDIYGESAKVEFLDFIRPEKKFASLNELKNQIQLDVSQAKDWSLCKKK